MIELRGEFDSDHLSERVFRGYHKHATFSRTVIDKAEFRRLYSKMGDCISHQHVRAWLVSECMERVRRGNIEAADLANCARIRAISRIEGLVLPVAVRPR